MQQVFIIERSCFIFLWIKWSLMLQTVVPVICDFQNIALTYPQNSKCFIHTCVCDGDIQSYDDTIGFLRYWTEVCWASFYIQKV